MDEDADKLKLQYLAGTSLINNPPIFSPDGSLLFVITDKHVQVFSVTTGQLTHNLEGAKDSIINLEFDVLDNNIIIGCTNKGELLRWKWANGVLKSRLQLNIKGVITYHTFNMMNFILKGDQPYALVTVVRKNLPVQLFVVNTVDGQQLKIPLDLKLKRQKPLVAVEKGPFKYFVIIQGQFLFFVNYKTWNWRKLTNTKNCPITCVNIHPEEEAVVTGDEFGKVVIWRNFFKVEDDVRMTLYHWHHTKVTSVVFSPTGTTFLSSGLEAVLVRWHMAHDDRKDFVPRMASAILHIALNSDSTSIAVSTADNGIQILGVDFKTTCTLQNFTYTFDDKTETDKFPVGLRINPRKNTFVLNGRAGHLQFYSAYTKTMLYNLEIVEQNHLSYETEKIIYNYRVTRAALNINWMATVEVFNDQQYHPEIRLKFWHYNERNQKYFLKTNVELPHEGGVRAIEFSNQYHVENLLCATVGDDNLIKIWAIDDPNNLYGSQTTIWCCIGQTSYRNMPIESIAFSEDGSLLAAGFANNLCIYKADSLKLMAVLTPGASFDGCLHKAQVQVPRVNRNGAKNDFSSKKQKIIQLFSNLLHTNDELLVKEIKNSIKSRKIQPITAIDNQQKQVLYKKVRAMNQLNLFQKLLIYQKLGISFQLNEEWHAKMLEYVQANVPHERRSNELKKRIHCLNAKTRFKAKYMIDKYVKRKVSYDQNVANKLAPLLSLLKIDRVAKTPPKPAPPLTNGIGGKEKELEESSTGSDKQVPLLQSLLTIKKILFCSGDFAHLVIACTENRLMIWNLLNLRLQTVLKLSTDEIAIDPKTNLISVFTKKRELYIFSPSDALTLYYRKDMPRVRGAVWLPKKQPKSQAFVVNWQSRSILYFLTDKNEIMYLGEDEEPEVEPLTFANESNGPVVKYTPFGTFATNQIKNTQNQQDDRKMVTIGVHGKAAVKSFLEMPSHTMAPLSLLCNDFLKSVVELNLPTDDDQQRSKVSKKPKLNGYADDSSSDNDEDFAAKRTLIETARLNTKLANNDDRKLNENYLQKIAAETIEIDF